MASSPTPVPAADSGCVYNYVVSAQRPTAVTHTAVGSITTEDSIDLVVGKSTVLELFTLRKDGLQPILECPLNGRLGALEVFRQEGQSRDSILLLTERHNIAIIRFDPRTGDWETIASGSVQQRVGNEAKNGPLAFLDPQNKIVGLHLYDGQLRIASIINGNFCHLFSIHMDELHILHMCFLSAEKLRSEKPVLAVLYEDTRHVRHLKTYLVDLQQKELEDGPWFQSTMAHTAEIIIPVHAYGGLLLVGESMISYLSTNDAPPLSYPVHEATFQCYAKVDDRRYLLSDHLGALCVLLLNVRNDVVEEVSFQRLGQATPAKSISYLDSGIFFIGSKSADSQLIQLTPSVTSSGSLDSPVKELSRFTNLGPILDFCVVDLERQGQCQIVACSGAYLEGSLRIIRNGIGITDQATVSLTGIKGLWSVKYSLSHETDAYLVVSFVTETRVLAFSYYNQDELTDAQIPGFKDDKQTLHCANMMHDTMLQVTPNEVVLVSCQTLQQVSEWRPDDRQIILASSSPSQILVGCEDGEVVYLLLGRDGIAENWKFKAEDEISCVDVTPIGEDPLFAQFGAVGTWDMNLLLLNLSTKSPPRSQTLGMEVEGFAVQFSMFEGAHYLLIAMGDGRLLIREIDAVTGELLDEKRVSIGTKPVTLSKFWSRDTAHVFASSDRPTVIYGEQKKLMFSNLNEQNVNFLTSFHTERAPECLALAKDDGLMIGNIDDIQKLHIKSVYLKEMPRRICHQPETHSYGVLCESWLSDGRPQNYFRIFDDETIEMKECFRFDYTETGTSILSTTLPDKPNGTSSAAFFLVGTAFVNPTEHDPSKGRLLAFSYGDAIGKPKLTVVTEKDFKGAVFSVKPLQDRIVATVNSKVHIVEWKVEENGAKSLHVRCTQHGHIMAIYSDVRDDFIVIDELEARARDACSNWMIAVKALDDDVYLGAENTYNLFTVKKVTTGDRDEEERLETVGQYHLGEYVNVLQEGSLVANPDMDHFLRPPVIFGTTNGGIGIILSLKPELFQFLEKLQAAMRKVIRPVGMFDHAEYRHFWNERQSKEARNFVDGDLIEAFLDLKRHDMDAVAENMKTPSDEIYKIVEDLSKLH